MNKAADKYMKLRSEVERQEQKMFKNATRFYFSVFFIQSAFAFFPSSMKLKCMVSFQQESAVALNSGQCR